jgi:DNA end-binding protein Ku
VKATEKMLILELMHFADEIVSAEGLKIPTAKLGKREEEMAMTLVNQMTEKWEPGRYTDDYKSALMKVIEAKVEAGGKELPSEKPKQRKATNVIDLVSVLQESLKHASSGGGGGKKTAVGKKRKPAAKKRTAQHRKAA